MSIKHITQEQIERGLRIKNIRENELHLNKTVLARKLGVSSQFLGLVEEGKGNLMYENIKRLKELSGHSADFILYGMDDEIILKTKKCMQEFGEVQIITAIDALKRIAFFIRNR